MISPVVLHADMAILEAKMKILWSQSPQKQQNYFQSDTGQAQKLRNVDSQLFSDEVDGLIRASYDKQAIYQQCPADGDGGKSTHVIATSSSAALVNIYLLNDGNSQVEDVMGPYMNPSGRCRAEWSIRSRWKPVNQVSVGSSEYVHEIWLTLQPSRS